MIVKNEESRLMDCLMSVKDIVDEIIIIDTGSEDSTKEVASKITDRIFDFQWENDFSKARNFAFSHATNDYILWLDADDILLKEDKSAFERFKSTLDPSVDAVMMKYNTAFDAQGNVTFSYYRERLVKRERQFLWKEPVHEYIEISGNIIQSDIGITHTKTGGGSGERNIAIYENIMSKGDDLSPRGMYYYARELKEHGRYGEAICFFNAFLDTKKGWVEDCITACAELGACYGKENQRDEQITALIKSFVYDAPRAEICCDLGYVFKAEGNYERAVFWFRLAGTLQKPKGNWGFIREDCWGYIPYIELAVCCDRLGMVQLAEQYNEFAGIYKPDDPSVELNRLYFKQRPGR